MNPTEKQDYLAGQVIGVMVAMQLLIELTPYPEASRQAIKEKLEGEVSSARDVHADDNYVAGLEAVRLWLTKASRHGRPDASSASVAHCLNRQPCG